MSDTLFLITARGGSKGLPGKNIKLLAGKPLLLYSIEIARRFVIDEHICLSTDDVAIKQCAIDRGLKVHFDRPSQLATDSASSYDVVLHALAWYQNNLARNYKKVVLLQPTSPLRTFEQVKTALNLYSEETQMVVGVERVKSNLYATCFLENQNGFIEKAFPIMAGERRQDSPEMFHINGAIYVYSVEALLNGSPATFTKIKKCEMPRENSIDIDDLFDWQMCEYLLKNKIVNLYAGH